MKKNSGIVKSTNISLTLLDKWADFSSKKITTWPYTTKIIVNPRMASM